MRVIKHYRWHTGTFAFVLHRLSGLALIGYLPLHIWVTGQLTAGPAAFNRTMGFVTQPIFHFLEWGLFGVILYHALNGLRLILVDLDLAAGQSGQKKVFWAMVIAGAAVWILSAPVLLRLM